MNFHSVFYSSCTLTLGLVSMAFCSFSCGRLPSQNTDSEIAMYGGQKDNGTFTSSVAIMRIYRDRTWVVTCTATKIARNMLLTAAHCVLPEDAPVNGKYLRPIYEPGSTQRIATGQNANTGPKQELKIKSVDLFPGFKERYQNCKEDCDKTYMAGIALVPDLSIHFPDMVVITYEGEIQNATTANLGVFDDREKLSISGYGLNISSIEFDKQKKNPSIDSKILGDKRFLQFTPSKFSDLIAKMKASVSPYVSDLDDDPQFFIPAEENMTIFVKLRDPVSHETFAKISKTLQPESVLLDMPKDVNNGRIMKGDSGGGIFNKIGKNQTVVGVVSQDMKEHSALPTEYIGIETAITKNPLRNTHKWISDLIKKNELKTPSHR